MLKAAQLELENKRKQQQLEAIAEMDRCLFTVVIGYTDRNDPIQEFEADLIQSLCYEYQGLSTVRGTGYWLTNDQFENAYDPNLHHLVNPSAEMNITINLSVYKDLEETTYKMIKDQVEFWAEHHQMNIEYVHCTTSYERARHFLV